MNQEEKTARQKIFEMFKHKEVKARISGHHSQVQFKGTLLQESETMWIIETADFELHISAHGNYFLQLGETLIIILDAIE